MWLYCCRPIDSARPPMPPPMMATSMGFGSSGADPMMVDIRELRATQLCHSVFGMRYQKQRCRPHQSYRRKRGAALRVSAAKVLVNLLVLAAAPLGSFARPPLEIRRTCLQKLLCPPGWRHFTYFGTCVVGFRAGGFSSAGTSRGYILQQ